MSADEPMLTDPRQIFALDEFRALRREIDSAEVIRDRILRRAILLVGICYLLIVFRTLPFGPARYEVPVQILAFLKAAPPVIVAISWLEDHLRYLQMKRLAGYIERIEALFYPADPGLGWERTLRPQEEAGFLWIRVHIVWFVILLATIAVWWTFDPTEIGVPSRWTGALTPENTG